MLVTYSKRINKNKDNRMEFWINNFDGEDGNEVIAQIFCDRFHMFREMKEDFIYFSVVKLKTESVCYEVLWHEDIGNVIYSLDQEISAVDMLESMLKVVILELNEKNRKNYQL